jgi:high-affinity nickel-transport protein
MLGAPVGVLARLCVPLFHAISESWRMLPPGLLFGLSFGTASEVGLLGISASQASHNGVVWSILVFPALFASAMTLVDTTDGVLMMHAYGWALINPRRKLWYDFAMTLASVAVAAFTATVQAVALLVNDAGVKGPTWQMIAALGDDLTTFGFVIVGIFTGTWLFSVIMPRETTSVLSLRKTLTAAVAPNEWAGTPRDGLQCGLAIGTANWHVKAGQRMSSPSASYPVRSLPA